MQEALNKEQSTFLGHMSLLMEHMALLTEAMTKLIKKYEIMLDDVASFRATLSRVEMKVDMLVKPEEEDLTEKKQ